MSTPIFPEAINTIVDRLENITVAGGFNFDVETVSRVYSPEPGDDELPKLVVFVDAQPGEPKWEPDRTGMIRMVILILGWVAVTGDTEEERATNRLLNAARLREDVKEALSDTVLGNNCTLALPGAHDFDVSFRHDSSSKGPRAHMRQEYSIEYFEPLGLTGGGATSLVSHGQIYSSSNATADVTVPGTFVRLTPSAAPSLAAAVRFDQPVDGRLRYTGQRAGVFQVTAELSCNNSALSGTRRLRIGLNGSVAGAEQQQLMLSNQHLSVTTFLTLSENNYVEVFLTSDQEETITVTRMNLVVSRVG